MATPGEPPRPWLIAAWPGMGNVAVIAAGHLVRELSMTPAQELPSHEHFDISEITVKDGLVNPVHQPRGLFFRWTHPTGGRDLVVFLGEAQPTSGTYAYARELLDAAAAMGVHRVVTFASMASALHPSASPKVAGIATDPGSLAELHRAEVPPMSDGQIGGLNGVLLAAAAERGLSGMCLLAEIPFFAANIPNPKAARAALSVFSILAGIDVSLDLLARHAAVVDRMLIDLYEKLQAQGAFDQLMEENGEQGDEGDSESGGEPRGGAGPSGTGTPPAKTAGSPESKPLDYVTRQRLEQLFDDARRDQSRAVALKQELDRLGVFAQYEDRFLDLFRRAG